MQKMQKLILGVLVFINLSLGCSDLYALKSKGSQNSGQKNTLSENDVSNVYKESLCAECEFYYEGNCYPDYSLYKTDDFGANCCYLLMKPVAILVRPTQLFFRIWGHAAVKTPNQTKGLYPRDGASESDPSDYGKIEDDSKTKFTDSFHYCACPETVKKIDDWIRDQEDKINSNINPWGGKPDETYHAYNIANSKNCIGWASLAIQSAGGKPPVNPDKKYLKVPSAPNKVPRGGPDGNQGNCP